MEQLVALAVGLLLVIVWLRRRPVERSSRAAVATVPRRPRPAVRYDVPRGAPDLGREAAVRGKAVWKRPGDGVEVQGLRLDAGLVYVGRGLTALTGGQPEPALIDPTLPVDRRRADWSGQGLDYWPSYARIPAGSRAAYLAWLAEGRPARTLPIGYVFLFFYGLERRLLVDARHLPEADADVPAIRAEVERLLGAYGDNGSFRSYASPFLGAINALWPASRAGGTAVPERGWELPLDLRARIGACLAAGEPLSASLAFAWLVAAPEVFLRTPATRCPAEFRRLFELRYRAAFGEGMRIRPPRRRLVAHYRPASASFGGPVDLPLGDLPDVAGLSAPVARLRELADACTAELDAYSRWLGRNPDGAHSLAAAALLPDDLLDGHQGEALAALRSWLDRRLGDGEPVALRGEELVRHWPTASGWQPTKAESVSLAQLLGKLGAGIEPDVRFDGPALAPSATVVLYRLPADAAPAAPTPEYALATLVAHLGMTVAAADGSVSEPELRRMDDHLGAALALSDHERSRLAAHLRWLRDAAPPLSGVKKRVATLSPAQRDELAEFLVAVAGSDGHVGPAEIASLGKVYGLLGLDASLVFRRVHAFATGSDGGPSRTGTPGPARADNAGEVTLDMARVGAKLRETQAVSALLGGVFADDDSPVAAPALVEPAVAGLDGAHTALLRTLQGRASMARLEFEGVTRGLGLLPDGAVDTINDAAFDRVGQPIVEGEDPLTIDGPALEEMLA